jgi:prepilin-type N-terminal cleavage/methylation domain-containing protein
MKQADRPGRRGSRAAFTLVEMLVVIAILGILMAMMVPAAGLILKRAKRATAQADAGVVVSVLLKYYGEYNRWPEFYTSAPGTDHFTDNVWVEAMSPDPTVGAPGVFNFKNIRFFEPSAGSLQTDPGKPQFGAFIDPWGNPFMYQLDLDQDGQIPHPDGSKNIRARAIAWSAGPDGDYTFREGHDNVVSWE